ncbi:uncharacterized protein LOC121371875 isoform X2 [Gigantopelta aegis]|uniref:uncharacterized protein LOC121371875 isoform X2 n=1 Tax=Gigantopelta aegis TaxID=1735272 RepID=UPI001B88C5DF|nr:uncharacterized protein LOC121371875 isoform X2 [Gigantopelta aegis]
METISKMKRAASSVDSNLSEDGEVPPKKTRQNESVGLFKYDASAFKDDSQKTEEYDINDALTTLSSQDSLPLLESIESLGDNEYVNTKSGDSQNTNGTHTFLRHSQIKTSQNNKVCKNYLTRLTKIPSIQQDAEVICSVIPHANFCTVYKKLEQNRGTANRMDIVFTEILDSTEDLNETRKHESEKPNESTDAKTREHSIAAKDLGKDDAGGDKKLVCSHPEESIFDEVSLVVKAIPDSNPNEVYDMLEVLEVGSDRVNQVVKQLKEKNNMAAKYSLKKDDSLPDDPALRNDPVFRDMRIISKMFPGKDRNEIYAYVEAHHDKSDRVQRVIEELLKSENSSQDQSLSQDITEPDCSKLAHTVRGAFRLQDEVDDLREIFPDCDPNYIFEELEKRSDDQERVKNLAGHMFERRNYPKLKDVLARQSKLALKNRLTRLKFNMEIFLSKFPDPLKTFYDCDKKMTENYKNHCLIQLKNDFPRLKDGYMKTVLESHNHHYTPVRKELQSQQAHLSDTGRQSKKIRSQQRESQIPLPEEPDEFFFHELLFYENEGRIKEHFKVKEEERQLQVLLAKEKGELYECGCCFDDECLFEDLFACADGHLFCKECVRRSTETALGEGKTRFPCLTGACDHDVPLSSLQLLLPSSLFSRLLRNLQEEEVQKAGIPDLETCPHCSFAAIMPDPNNKVFHCLNTECLKETCRFCKEPNHVPLKCNEVEKQGETNMRTYIETRISEAMLRQCHRCKKRFYKDTGCNKMTCTCGASSCYVCREPDIDYDHFSEHPDCGNIEQAEVIHKREMEKAAEEAKEQYLRDHPDAAQLSLTYDPIKYIEQWMLIMIMAVMKIVVIMTLSMTMTITKST